MSDLIQAISCVDVPQELHAGNCPHRADPHRICTCDRAHVIVKALNHPDVRAQLRLANAHAAEVQGEGPETWIDALTAEQVSPLGRAFGVASSVSKVGLEAVRQHLRALRDRHRGSAHNARNADRTTSAGEPSAAPGLGSEVVECPSDDCPRCTAESCVICGPVPNGCTHDVVERHDSAACSLGEAEEVPPGESTVVPSADHAGAASLGGADAPEQGVIAKLQDDNGEATLITIVDEDGDGHLRLVGDGGDVSAEFCTKRGGGQDPEFTRDVRRFIAAMQAAVSRRHARASVRTARHDRHPTSAS